MTKDLVMYIYLTCTLSFPDSQRARGMCRLPVTCWNTLFIDYIVQPGCSLAFPMTGRLSSAVAGDNIYGCDCDCLAIMSLDSNKEKLQFT